MSRPYNEKDLNRQRIQTLLIVGPIPILSFIIGAIFFRESVLGLTLSIVGAIFFSLLYTAMLIIYKNRLIIFKKESSENKK
ncbi:Uncharacterised protein [Acholeplasma oculi]|uniref:Uncharacterized protein n=1 Tax=Acholeplasma oculi TaxID=35623 RepID=A0A061A8W6_9MOLU|nr:hypothetical protein [Acholeplasma oculi]CDR30283.1 hypothetical protein Aocu_02100 [Acholeplasma oculi]SKC43345.1 hypothetical protein SAMN02745122_0961 [Acholeplasma oculi]SUT88719.1 Uncharacterised protein [Acholeplasma oculi]